MLTDVVWEQLHGVTFKKRAPKAIKEIKAFATKAMVCTYPQLSTLRSITDLARPNKAPSS